MGRGHVRDLAPWAPSLPRSLLQLTVFTQYKESSQMARSPNRRAKSFTMSLPQGGAALSQKKLVCIGLLGPTLDAGLTHKRWGKWRPTISLVQHPDLLIDRFELLHQRRFDKLAAQVIEDMDRLAPETQVRTHDIALEDPWDFELVYQNLYDFARSYPFNIEEEDYLLHITTGSHVAQICCFLLAESRHIPARLIQSSPGHRGSFEPGTFKIIDLDLSRYDQLFSRFAQEQREGVSFLKEGIETRNEAFNFLIEQIERVAIVSSDPMLLTGPTGAGKTQLARRIYELKRVRRQVSGRFVEVNCATLRGDGAMSTLFGHVRGAYTGAVSERGGLLRAADGGVLFLDEIGELGQDEQAMLLRAVESGRFMPVGADHEVSSNFQLLAGTNRDLNEEVRKGRFREDLLARIDLWSFDLPGLRDRLEDIEPNIDYELEQFTVKRGSRVAINREARDRYLRYATSMDARWSGNFRDLNASITRMATLARGGRINEEDVEQELIRLGRKWQTTSDARQGAAQRFLIALVGEESFRDMDRFDRVQLTDVVDVCRRARSLSEAGRELFAFSREQKKSNNDSDRLRKYLAKFDIDFKQIQALDEGASGGG